MNMEIVYKQLTAYNYYMAGWWEVQAENCIEPVERGFMENKSFTYWYEANVAYYNAQEAANA